MPLLEISLPHALTTSWPWYVAGPIIAGVMLALLYLGREFGVSSNLRALCSIAGAGKAASFFRFDWKAERWNLVFVFGVAIGGAVAAHVLTAPEGNVAHVSDATLADLREAGIPVSEGAPPMVPEFFDGSALGILLLLGGGFLIGFGSRYAGGCTSGHAISGMSNLQPASLVAVIGFFIGGLIATFLLLPVLF